MIRPLIIVVNLLIAFWVQLLSTEPSAEVTAPASVNAGESFVVNAIIKPNGETGFMRFAMELQPGWTAEKIETAGASFLFEKNSANENFSAKFLWSRMDGTSDLKISFRVTCPASASGVMELPCKISHTVDNLPANIQLSPVKITVNNASAPNGNNNVRIPDSTAKPPAYVSIIRTVPTEPVSGEFLVDIVINKEDLVNFGKIQDSLPDGFMAKQVMTDGSTFSFENGVVKFYWPVLPKKPSLHIQYKVIASPDMKGSQLISGYFSYVENETGKITRIPLSMVNMKENPALVENKLPEEKNGTDSTPPNGQANKQTNPPEENGNSQNGQANKETNKQVNEQQGSSGNSQQGSSSSQSSSSSSSASVTYSVQIAAMMRRVPVEYYSSTFSISGTINMEQSDGLNRYTNGSFSAYEQARNHRESIRSKGVNDAFVTAYSNGKRITVQEALMITNQKWLR